MKLSIIISAMVLVTCTLSAHAQTMKPGLWEIKNQMQSDSGDLSEAMAQAQKEMESLPADQRKMMQDMMAKQGIQMGSTDGSGMTIKVCLTQEMFDRNEITARQGKNNKDCTYSNSPRTGNTMKFSFACKNPVSKGDGQITFTSSQAYSMKMDITSIENGKPQRMQMQNSARWLSTDCGNIKPAVVPKK